LAIRDCRAASCLRIRDGKFRAAAIPAPRGRRNHQAAVEAVDSPMVITAYGDVPMSVQAMKTPTELRRSLTCRPALCDTGYIVCSIGCQDCVGTFAKWRCQGAREGCPTAIETRTGRAMDPYLRV
jgi:hypothetical protein